MSRTPGPRTLLAGALGLTKHRGTLLFATVRLSSAPAAAAILVGIAIGWGISWSFGGAHHIAPDWFYIPTILAAARFGPRGALLTGTLSAVVGGPLLPDDVAQGRQQELSEWISQGAFYVILGVFLGYIFDRLRTSFTRDLELVHAEHDNTIREMNLRVTLEKHLRDSEERYRTAFAQAGTGNILASLDGVFLEVNQTLCRMLGYSQQEVMTLSMRDITHREDLEDSLQAIRRVRAGEISVAEFEKRYYHKDGHVIWAQVNLALVQDADGKPLYLINQIQDITERKQAAEMLRASEDRYRSLVETSPDGILLADLTGTILVANPAAAQMYGYGSPDDLRGVNALQLTAPQEHERLRASIAQTAQSGRERAETVEYRQVRADGTTFPAETRAGVIRDGEGRPQSFLVAIRDISERKQAENATRQLAAIVEAASDAVMGMTLEGIITSWNASAEQIFGYSAAEIMGQPSSILVPPDRLNEQSALFEQVKGGVPIKHLETVRLRKDGRRIDVSLSISPLVDEQGRSTAYAATAFDITERKTFEEQLKHQALHDALTGLPNRILLRDRLEQSLLAARRGAASMGLLLLDLNRFKEINDTLGHQAGDTLLQEVAFRLQETLRASDSVARLGGDEFAVVLAPVDVTQACHMADKIHAALHAPLVLDGHRIDIDVSIGIAMYPAHGDDARTLLQHADVAMYAAKRRGGVYSIYSPDDDLTSPSRLALVGDLRRAIDQDQLLLHYQPKVNMRTGRSEHVEALVRWQHPEHGLIPPGEFVSLAEDTGLIEPLTLWVLRTALHQCALWHRRGLDIGVAVNLSTRNLQDPHLPETVAWLLRSSGLLPSTLTLEITETSLMEDPEQAMALLIRLHQMGVKISVDDFGTGYSSLAYLKQLPADEIKIDRSFVMSMTRTGTVIVRSVIDLGRNLGLEVTAEGVENREAWDMLARMGCSTAQGYFVSRPLPVDDVMPWMATFHETVTQRPAADNVILVVDDNPVYQELLHVLLTGEGYDVLTAGDAEAALDMLATRTPNLILTDVQLPGMSGLDLVQRIRSDVTFRDTIIVAITGAPRPEDEQHALSVGCDVYAAKPKSNVDVIRLVQRYLAA